MRSARVHSVACELTQSWTSYDTFDPIIDFGKYLDGENLEQEDLVIWFNLGMHHVPHTGDLANTVSARRHPRDNRQGG